MALLRVRKGKQPGAVYPVLDNRRPTVIGRDASASVSLSDGRASRKHARIFRAYGSWLLQDLDSRNGTLLDGKPVKRAALTDRANIQIGNTLLAFHEEECVPPPAKEIYGCRLLDTNREEAGVFVYSALQSALDREVRIDHAPTPAIFPPRTIPALAAAAAVARKLDHPRLDSLVHAEFGRGAEVYVVLRSRSGAPLHTELAAALKQSFASRLLWFRQLVEALFARAAGGGQRTPIGLHQIRIGPWTNGTPELSLPALELPAFATLDIGNLCHHPHYVPYLPPEFCTTDETPAMASDQALLYQLGSFGYHLLTTQPPMGNVSARKTLENHQQLEPAPAHLLSPDVPPAVSELLSNLLAKDPKQRPDSVAEVLDVLDTALRSATPEAAAPRPAPTPERIESAIATRAVTPVPALEEPRIELRARARPNAPPAAAARPSEPVSRAGVTSRPAAPEKAGAAMTRQRGLLFLPLWVAFWVVLFVGARYLSRLLFSSI